MVKSIQAVLILTVFSFSVSAHEFNPAHLVIKEVETNTYQTEWMYPAKNIGARGEVLFPQDCIRENTQFEKNGRYLVETFSLICESTLKGQKINLRWIKINPLQT